GIWFGRSLIAIYTKEGDKHNLKYILSLLNSSYMVKMYRNLVKETGRVFPQVKLSKVKQLPIRKIDFSNPSDKRFHDDLVALVDVMLDLNKKLSTAQGSEKDHLQRQIEQTDKEIDELVYKLYGITEEEKKVIEGE
ncbi:MAG: restriction endonuclease subunit M, partial [Candidatus Omnitrophica bacterium]|nr:restriction endonuclease subunit M [Candidatus Omnitrophota bacterium]